MLARSTKNLVWIMVGLISALLFSASSHADYLYKGQYYKNRQDGSAYPVHPRGHRNRGHRYRSHRGRGHRSRGHRSRRGYAHPTAPHAAPYRSVSPSSGRGTNSYQQRHGKFKGLEGHRVEGAKGRRGTGTTGYSNPAVAPKVPVRRYRKACKSVDAAIWAAQRIYPGGRVISARPKKDHTGRRVSVEIRIMYKGRVAVVRERC